MKTRLLILMMVIYCAAVLIGCGTANKRQKINAIKQKYSEEQLMQAYRVRIEGQKDTSFLFPTPDELKKVDLKLLWSALVESQRTIYGSDNVKDWYQINSTPLRARQGNAVWALVKRSDISPQGTDFVINGSKLLKNVAKYCGEVRFQNQPVASSCSGFAISKRMVVTAGHCIDSNADLNNYYLVYGYHMKNQNDVNLKVPATNVFKFTSILDRKKDDDYDFTVLIVDRDIQAERIWPIRTSGKLQNSQLLCVAGYPLGLPLKFADSGRVRRNVDDLSFISNLDVYGGNSGSPVFDQHTGRVEGLLIGGGVDFLPDWENDCRQSMICPVGGCKGELVGRTSQFLDIYNLNKARY